MGGTGCLPRRPRPSPFDSRSRSAFARRPLSRSFIRLEGAKLPPLKEIFVFGAVVPGSTLTINGSTVPVHPKGGYLAMVPLAPGDVLLNLDAVAPGGQTAHLDRRFSVAPGWTMSSVHAADAHQRIRLAGGRSLARSGRHGPGRLPGISGRARRICHRRHRGPSSDDGAGQSAPRTL